jgi:hypothetical protein
MDDYRRAETVDISSERFPDSYLKKLHQDPISKYQQHSKHQRDECEIEIFPWRLLIHILLVIATSAQIMILTHNGMSHSQGDVRYLYHWFTEDAVSPQRPVDRDLQRPRLCPRNDRLRAFGPPRLHQQLCDCMTPWRPIEILCDRGQLLRNVHDSAQSLDPAARRHRARVLWQ